MKTYLCKKELAAHFKVSLRTIDNWMRRRTIPFEKVGRIVRFDLEKCEKALNAFEHHSVS